MRKLTYFVATTLDGFIAGPSGRNPTGPGGFFDTPEDYLNLIISEYPETLPGPAREALGVTDPGTHFDTVVEGRRSYEVGLDEGLTNAYPHLRHLVFSRTMTQSPDPTVELVSGDPVEKVRDLKREDGKGIWLVGGGTLAGALYDEIDELIVKVNPIVTRTGLPLFGGEFSPRKLELVHHHVLDSGTAFMTYHKAKAER